jgi:D-galactarolactone cycloisomerase
VEYDPNRSAPICLVEYDVGENPLRDALLATPLLPEEGYLTVPDGPGLGIALDPDAVRRLAGEA